MKSNIILVKFGTFGNPNGFRQTFLEPRGKAFVGNKEVLKGVKAYDLNTNAIKIFPGSRIYSIRKEYVTDHKIISYSVYSYAKERNSERSGTFIGSSLLYTEKIAEESVTLNILNEFQDSIIRKNVENDIIKVNHSEKLEHSNPKDFNKIDYNLKEIEDVNFLKSTNRVLVVFCHTDSNILQQFFKKSIDLLNVYDSIYFTKDEEVAKFVRQKGIFRLTDTNNFEQELNNLYTERELKTATSIAEFEEKIQKLDEDRKNTLNDIKSQIEQKRQIHIENDVKIKEFIKGIDDIDISYNDFSIKIKDLINKLKSGKNPEEVKRIYIENEKLFIESINQFKKPILINDLPRVNVRSTLRVENHQSSISKKSFDEKYNRYQDENDVEKQVGQLNPFLVSTIILILLLIASWSFMIYNSRRLQHTIDELKYQINSQESEGQANNDQEDGIAEMLTPKPNSELSEKDYRAMAKEINYDISVSQLVSVIFGSNPTDIKSTYAGQEDRYSKQIFELNKECFEEKGGVLYFVKDTLRHIPSFKK